MDILQQCIDNFNYRNGQIVQPKHFDTTTPTGPQNNLLKIKYPIKPVNGTNHQTNNYTSASKFQRPKFTWQVWNKNTKLHKKLIIQSILNLFWVSYHYQYFTTF